MIPVQVAVGDASSYVRSHRLFSTGDCVFTECPDNYRVSKVGALGKKYLPSVNTRKT